MSSTKHPETIATIAIKITDLSIEKSSIHIMKDAMQKTLLMKRRVVIKTASLLLLIPLGIFTARTSSAVESCVVNIQPIDGCTVPGEQVKDVVSAFGTNFTASCNQHDICYRQIGTSQSMCDAELLHNTRKSCIEGPDGEMSANFAAVILSCGAPTRLSETGNASLAPDSPTLYNDGWSNIRDTVLKPVRQVVDLGEDIGSGIVKAATSAGSSIAAEYHRIDDNAKEFRDNVVYSLVDGLETVEGVLETLPGSTYVFAVTGRPSEMLSCVFEETLAFARDVDLWEQINPASTLYSASAYPSCVVASNAMYNGPRAYAQFQRANGETTVYENRQSSSLIEADRIAISNADGSCLMTAKASSLFRPVTNDAIISNTIRRIFDYMINRTETSAEYDLVRRHALADPENWQFNLINALRYGTNLASLPMVSSYERTRPGILDIQFRGAMLADYSAIESITAKRVMNLHVAKIVAGQ
jgi:hypothetical protein